MSEREKKKEREREREREREKEKPEELTRSLQLTLATLQAVTSFGPSYLSDFSLVAVSARLHVGASLAFMTAHMQYRLSNYSCVQNYSCVR